MWEEVYPNLKFEVPQRRGAFHDSGNGFLSQFGVEMMSKVWSFNGGFNGEEEEEKSKVGVRRRASKFFCWVKRERTWLFKKKWFSFSYFFFHKTLATCPTLSGTKRGPPLPLDVTSYSAARREKFYLLNAKILSRFACRFSGSRPSRFSAPVGARFRK